MVVGAEVGGRTVDGVDVDESNAVAGSRPALAWCCRRSRPRRRGSAPATSTSGSSLSDAARPGSSPPVAKPAGDVMTKSPVNARSMTGTEGRLGRRREDRDERDQADADHQRGRGRGRPLRVAHRVLAGQLAGDARTGAAAATDEPAEREGHRSTRAPTPRRTPAAPRGRRAAGVVRRAEKPEREGSAAQDEQPRTDDDPLLGAVAGAPHGDFTHRSHGRHLAGLAGRRDAGDERDHDARRPSR